jgi:hypothetical protein
MGAELAQESEPTWGVWNRDPEFLSSSTPTERPLLSGIFTLLLSGQMRKESPAGNEASSGIGMVL